MGLLEVREKCSNGGFSGFRCLCRGLGGGRLPTGSMVSKACSIAVTLAGLLNPALNFSKPTYTVLGIKSFIKCGLFFWSQ